MPFSTFDIVKVSPEIKKLHETLLEAIKPDADGKFTVTNEEANAIGELIVSISKKIARAD
jgi:hypothetical protein